MAKYLALDGDGTRVADFEADSHWTAYGIALQILQSANVDVHRWSLLEERNGGTVFLFGAGLHPPRAEAGSEG